MKQTAFLLLLSALLATPAHGQDIRLQIPTGAYAVQVSNWRDLPFRTVIRQQYDYSCGSAALATLLTHHYGRPSSEAAVFEAMFARGDQEAIRTRGFSLLDMQRYLAHEGLPADGYRLSFDRLSTLGAPAITTISTRGYRHFVVVKGVRNGQVLIGDPSAGLVTYRQAEFERVWQNVTFIIHDESARGQFNREDEWRLARPPRFSRLQSPRPIEPLTRDLPPLYQITPVAETNP